MPYSESTWEEASLISHWYQDNIDDYLERNSSDRIPTKNAKVLRHRPRFMFMKEQLDSLNSRGTLKLRDYQLDGVNWLVRSWCKYVHRLVNSVTIHGVLLTNSLLPSGSIAPPLSWLDICLSKFGCQATDYNYHYTL